MRAIARAQPDAAASAIEGDVSFWTGTPEQIAETMLAYRRVGFHTFIVELAGAVRRRDDGDPDERREAEVEEVPIPA